MKECIVNKEDLHLPLQAGGGTYADFCTLEYLQGEEEEEESPKKRLESRALDRPGFSTATTNSAFRLANYVR